MEIARQMGQSQSVQVRKLQRGLRVAPGREDIRFGVGKCFLGPVLVALSDQGVVEISMGDDVEELIEELHLSFLNAEISREDRECRDAVAHIVACIENPSLKLEVPLDIRGTDFQKRVWQAVRKVSFGKIATYSDIAAKIGKPKAIRAVGTACAKSPCAVVIPCHRILHKDGSLSGGYYGTTGRQRELLEREASLKPKKEAKPKK